MICYMNLLFHGTGSCIFLSTSEENNFHASKGNKAFMNIWIMGMPRYSCHFLFWSIWKKYCFKYCLNLASINASMCFCLLVYITVLATAACLHCQPICGCHVVTWFKGPAKTNTTGPLLLQRMIEPIYHVEAIIFHFRGMLGTVICQQVPLCLSVVGWWGVYYKMKVLSGLLQSPPNPKPGPI